MDSGKINILSLLLIRWLELLPYILYAWKMVVASIYKLGRQSLLQSLIIANSWQLAGVFHKCNTKEECYHLKISHPYISPSSYWYFQSVTFNNASS
jgi:hypothetical protein